MKAIILFIFVSLASFALVSAQTPSTPIPLTAPKPIATPVPALNLSAKLPAPTVAAAMAALSQFVALPPGVAPTQIRSITIFIAKDGTAAVNVR
jgi:hypothetical protein